MALMRHPPFAALLKRFRLAARLTQEELAERAHLSARTITALERGVNERPRKDTIRLLAAALGLTEEERADFEAAARGWTEPDVIVGVPAPPASLAGIPLVGRSRELGLLEGHLGGEGPAMLLLAGEPGIGKTRLLWEAVQRGRAGGMTVLWAGCQRRDGQQAYSPVLDALARHVAQQPQARLRALLRDCAWLVRLLPELEEIVRTPVATLAPEQEQRLLFAAVGRYLTNAAGPGGTLLVLDDLQWAGRDALDLLTTVVQSVPEAPVRVVGAYRQTEVAGEDALPAALGEWARQELARQVVVGPLPREEAVELLAKLLEQEEGIGREIRERIVERAEGVPFFLVSSAQALRVGGKAGEEPAWSIAESVRQRVAALSPEAQEVLHVAAVAGRIVARHLLLAVVKQPEEKVVAALEAACRAGLLREKGERGYRFVHDVIREVIEEDLGAARRAALHREIAEALEGWSGQEKRAAELAWHFRQGDDPERALQYAVLAGDQAEAVYAHREAEGHYRMAIGLARELGNEPGEAAALEKLGAVLTLEAEYDAARGALEQAAHIYRATANLEGLGRAAARIGRVSHQAGRTATETLERLQSLLEPLEAAPPSPVLPEIHSQLASLHFLSGGYPEQLAAAERAARLASLVGDDRTLVEAIWYQGLALFLLGRLEESMRICRSALSRAEALMDLDKLCEMLGGLAVIYLHMGKIQEARLYPGRAVELAERLGNPWQICLWTACVGLCAFIAGDWPEARQHFERALRLGEHSRAPYALWQAGWLELAEGEWERAGHTLENSMIIPRQTGNLQALRWATALLAELDLLQGKPEEGRARLLPLLDRPGLRELDVTFLLPRLAWAHLELGEVERAMTLAAEAVERARAQGYHLALADALRVQAVAQARGGRREEAQRVFEEAVTLCRKMPYPYAEARALYEWGRAHLEQRRPDQARERLTEALAIFRRLGARPYVEWTQRELARLS